MLSSFARLRPRVARAVRTVLFLDLAGALCVVIFAMALVGLVYAILHRNFDYDEVEHAYATWLVSRGLKPFRDFFECHPPFLWYPLGLLFRVFGDSYRVIFAFRFIMALGQVAFLVGVGKNIVLSLRELQTPLARPVRTAALAIAVIALHPPPAVFDYLLEFRVDAWPNAVLLIAIYRYRSRCRDAFRSSVELGALSAAAVLCSPKLVILAALFALASLIVGDRRLLRSAGMLAGGAGALAVGAGFLLIAGVNPIHAFQLSLQYHHVLNIKGGFGNSFWREVMWDTTVARFIVIPSVLAWLLVVGRRIHRATFEVSVLLFLALQLKFVAFPFNQYFSPWFMLGIAFVPYLEVVTARLRPLHALLLAVAFLYTGADAAEDYRVYADRHEAADDFRQRQALEALVPRDGFVVGTIETMPLFRRSSFYQVVNSMAPSGYDGARVMQELKLEGYSKRFTDAEARAELEAQPPDLIFTRGSYPAYQRRALDAYIARHATGYVPFQGDPSILMRRR